MEIKAGQGDLLDPRNSGDTAGSKDCVAGHGAFVFAAEKIYSGDKLRTSMFRNQVSDVQFWKAIKPFPLSQTAKRRG